jgi:hypothetical protein
MAERVAMLGLAIVLATLLGVAAWMQPHPDGVGTHQQLGLPPCSLLWITGIRCPACGMTTAWAWFLDGHPWRSLQANLGGTLLCVLALVACPGCTVLALRGTGSKGSWFSRWMLIGLCSALGMAALEWVARLAS